MVKIEKIETKLSTAGPYSPCIKAGNMIFVSGQIGLPAENIQDQTAQAFKKIKELLENAGATVKSIVKVNVYLKDINDFSKMNEAYERFFKENGMEIYPTRTTVEVSNLPIEKMLIEIDCISVI
ncbi:MAG: RidA family protein [Candidatus Helarchaeota archaeon]